MKLATPSAEAPKHWKSRRRSHPTVLTSGSHLSRLNSPCTEVTPYCGQLRPLPPNAGLFCWVYGIFFAKYQHQRWRRNPSILDKPFFITTPADDEEEEMAYRNAIAEKAENEDQGEWYGTRIFFVCSYHFLNAKNDVSLSVHFFWVSITFFWCQGSHIHHQ